MLDAGVVACGPNASGGSGTVAVEGATMLPIGTSPSFRRGTFGDAVSLGAGVRGVALAAAEAAVAAVAARGTDGPFVAPAAHAWAVIRVNGRVQGRSMPS